jgi:hypothetical protein
MDKVRVMPVNNVDVAVAEVNAVNKYRLFVEKVEVLEPFKKVFAKMMMRKRGIVSVFGNVNVNAALCRRDGIGN